MSISFDPLIALRTLSVFKVYCTTVPLAIHALRQTIAMIDMFTIQLDDWFLTKALNITDCAVGFSILTKSRSLIFFNAFFMKTRRMTRFEPIPSTTMPAFQNLHTALSCLPLARTLSTNGLHFTSNVAATESTLFLILFANILFTSFADMVRFQFTFNAEIVATFVAAYTIGSHVICSLL